MPILIANEATSDFGGIQRYMARLAREFARDGARVDVVEPASPDRRLALEGVRFHRFRAGGRAREFALALARYVPLALARRGRPTIASIWFPTGLVVALLPRALRGPLGILAHGTELAPSRGGPRRALLRFTFARADVAFANSRYTADLVRSCAVACAIETVPCGVDPAPPEPPSQGPPTLLSVGRLIARKGFDRTIDAMPAILRAVPEARYRIVGDGPQRAALEARVDALGLRDRVSFAGAIGDDALRAEFANAWCFVMPARRIGDDVEGFGIVYLEAAMAGRPSIGGRGSGAEDAIEDGVTGTLVDGESSQAIADAAIAYLSDRTSTFEVGERARRRALDSFAWSSTADAIAAWFRARTTLW